MKGRILDIGIGPGWFEKFFRIKTIGTDVDKNSKANVIAGGDFLPFPEHIFDFVVCLDTIHLLTGKDIKRVLKPNGLFLVSHFVNKGSEKEVKKTLLNMFSEFKLLKSKVVGDREKDLILLLKK
jgi:SAM-dependent methyltransferase